MKKQLRDVEEFHVKFLQEMQSEPSLLSLEESRLRFKLMEEENEEYLEAAKNDDIVEIADALGDQLYILCGTILKHGLQHKIEEVFDLIHSNNMAKLGPDGKPIFREDGKIIKPKGFKKVELKTLFQ